MQLVALKLAKSCNGKLTVMILAPRSNARLFSHVLYEGVGDSRNVVLKGSKFFL